MKLHCARWFSGRAATAACLVFSASGLHGDTVSFNDATRGPADALQIAGVTITGYNNTGGDAGQPATLLNYGLGVDNGVGPVSEIDRQQYFSLAFAGGFIPASDSGVVEGLTLQVDGTINSITVQPEFRIYSQDGTLLPGTLPFSIYCYGNNPGSAGPHDEYDYLSGTNPVTISPNFSVGSISIDITDGAGEYSNFQSYLATLSGNETFQYGVSILSLDYTPVPEPSSLALGMVLPPLLCLARHWSRAMRKAPGPSARVNAP